jgi:phosphoribosylaminoimidazolecarboxamide formyltransferase/IMP cyclohydrolase
MTSSETSRGWALISVSNKSLVQYIGSELIAHGFRIISTGGSAKALRESGLHVEEVSSLTGFPEMMGGRVKTLHPKIHGGILARRPEDLSVANEHEINLIDIVVVNLYPFEETIAKKEVTLEEAVENIDIGGPALLRAAAKNHASVAAICDPEDYKKIITELSREGEVSSRTRNYLAVKAFSHTATYDKAVTAFLSDKYLTNDDLFPKSLSIQMNLVTELRYGENPHQKAAFYREAGRAEGSLASARQHSGKELSYNNLADTDAALDCVRSFDMPACCIVKHANPCGVSEADNIADAYEKAYRTDPTSAFGGVIAFNGKLHKELAQTIVERQFVEVIVASEIDVEALQVIESKPNIRCLEVRLSKGLPINQLEYKRVTGGLLVQERDNRALAISEGDLSLVTKRAPTAEEIRDMLFAWKVVACVKSNAIVYARDSSTVGIGAGQMSRVYSSKIAAIKARDEGLSAEGSVMASDAFFPFRDGVDAAAEQGVSAVIQPGGSVRDEEVIKAADEAGISMVFTGERHFRH